jgi:hypothetical protein
MPCVVVDGFAIELGERFASHGACTAGPVAP